MCEVRESAKQWMESPRLPPQLVAEAGRRLISPGEARSPAREAGKTLKYIEITPQIYKPHQISCCNENLFITLALLIVRPFTFSRHIQR